MSRQPFQPRALPMIHTESIPLDCDVQANALPCAPCEQRDINRNWPAAQAALVSGPVNNAADSPSAASLTEQPASDKAAEAQQLPVEHAVPLQSQLEQNDPANFEKVSAPEADASADCNAKPALLQQQQQEQDSSSRMSNLQAVGQHPVEPSMLPGLVAVKDEPDSQPAAGIKTEPDTEMQETDQASGLATGAAEGCHRAAAAPAQQPQQPGSSATGHVSCNAAETQPGEPNAMSELATAKQEDNDQPASDAAAGTDDARGSEESKRSAADIFEQTVMDCKALISDANGVLLEQPMSEPIGNVTSQIAAKERATTWRKELQGLMNRCKIPQLYIGVLGDTGVLVCHCNVPHQRIVHSGVCSYKWLVLL